MKIRPKTSYARHHWIPSSETGWKTFGASSGGIVTLTAMENPEIYQQGPGYRLQLMLQALVQRSLGKHKTCGHQHKRMFKPENSQHTIMENENPTLKIKSFPVRFRCIFKVSANMLVLKMLSSSPRTIVCRSDMA